MNISFLRNDNRDRSMFSEKLNEEKGYIQGTNFNLDEVSHLIENFILKYNPPGVDPSGLSYYMKKIKTIKETSVYYLVVSL